MKRARLPLIARILIGFATGTAAGLALAAWCPAERIDGILAWVSPFGSVLIAMLKAVVYPIILFSLIAGAAALPLRKSGRVGGAVLLWYTATSLFATVLGVLLAFLLNPTMRGGAALAAGHLAGARALAGGAKAGSLAEFLIGLFQNPFAALAEGQFLPVIVFAIAFGLASRFLLDRETEESDTTGHAVRTLLNVIDGAQRVSFKLIDWVVLYFPIGVFALSVTNFATHGTLLFGPYLRIAGCVVLGVLTMLFVVYPSAIFLFCRKNPFPVLLHLKEAMLTAFVTRSSAATLPVSFRTMDALGVDRALSGFSLPMGATVNMDGVCVHLPVFVMLAANLFGHDLSMIQIAGLCLSIMFASVGAGGIPGGSVFLLFMVLESMGLPGDQVTLIVALALGINPLLDMFETCCNVTGDNVCTYIVAHRTGLLSGPEPGKTL